MVYKEGLNIMVCQHCKKRCLGCHDKCPEYQAFKKEESEKKDQRKKVRSAENAFFQTTTQCRKKR